MQYKLHLNAPVRVFAPQVNQATEAWGVYSIPRLWREPDGTLVIRLGGEQDDGFAACKAPDLYFASTDNGVTWAAIPNGAQRYDLTVLTGIDPPYLPLKNGDTIALCYRRDCCDIARSTPYRKHHILPNRAAACRVYRYGDIPDAAKGMELLCIRDGHKQRLPALLDFPAREVALPSEALTEDGCFAPVPIQMHYNIFATTYISGLCELPSGELVGVAHGQAPAVFDRQCEEVYCLSSLDGGKSWKKKATIATATEKYPYGFGGDGGEISLAVTGDGTLLCAMRMELSIAPPHFCSTMLAISHDGGFTWCEPFPVAESSVTPHVVALQNGIAVLVYGRPGVHLKISTDNGATWSDSHSLIGRTLTEERQAGVTDHVSKYLNMISYANTFVEKIDENSFLVVYNAMGKFKENGVLLHKAIYVQKITVTPK